MTVTCPTCGRTIPLEDVNVQGGYAKCAACNELFMVSTAAAPVAAPVVASKAEVTMPNGFSMHEWMGDLLITRRWFTPAAFGLLFFTLFWNGILSVFYVAIINGDAPKFMLLFLSLHTLVGLGVLYATLASFLNTTVFRVSGAVLSVRHGPIPWKGNGTYSAANIAQLFCEEVVTNGRNGTSRTYRVRIMQRQGELLTLVEGLEQPSHARFLEQELETRLGIQDQPVAGELVV